MSKCVDPVAASKGSKEWSWGLMLFLVVLNADLGLLKLGNPRMQPYKVMPVLSFLARALEDLGQNSSDPTELSTHSSFTSLFLTINTSLLLFPAFSFFYIFVELPCLTFPFCLLQLQTPLSLSHKLTEGRIQSQRVSSTIPCWPNFIDLN